MSNKIQYRRICDYLILNLILPPEEANVTLGKCGMMHKSYLEKHKKVLFNSLLIQGKLYQHCAEVEAQARDMFETLIEQMKEAEGVTEQLKEENQLEWVCRMGNIEQRQERLSVLSLSITEKIRDIRLFPHIPVLTFSGLWLPLVCSGGI